MIIPVETIRALPVGELRRLVRIGENIDQIQGLLEKRDRLLEEARRIQSQIDDLIASTSGRPRRKRPGPSVKTLCVEVLRGHRSGLTAAQIKDAILEKHPHRRSRTFYNQVFIALTRSSEFRKLSSGSFVWDGAKSGRRAAGAQARGTGRKSSRKKTKKKGTRSR